MVNHILAKHITSDMGVCFTKSQQIVLQRLSIVKYFIIYKIR